MIRALLKAFEYPSAAPHVYSGVESTLPLLARMAAAAPDTPSKRGRRSTMATRPSVADVSDTRVLALVAVMLFYVLSRMMDQEITPEQFQEWRDTAVSTLLESKAGKDATEEDILEEIDQLMPMAQEEGWLQMEWFLNVLPADEGEEMEGVEMTSGHAKPGRDRRKGLKDGGSDYIGLGTMMQDATDYLSERQRADYERWKAKIMARVEEIEAS